VPRSWARWARTKVRGLSLATTGFGNQEMERKYVLWATAGAARRSLDMAFLGLQSAGNLALTRRFWLEGNTEVSASIRIGVLLVVQTATLIPLGFALFRRALYAHHREWMLAWMRVAVALTTALLHPAPACRTPAISTTGEVEADGWQLASAGGLYLRVARAALVVGFQVVGFQVRFRTHVLIQLAQVFARVVALGLYALRSDPLGGCEGALTALIVDLVVVDIVLTSAAVLVAEARTRSSYAAALATKKELALETPSKPQAEDSTTPTPQQKKAEQEELETPGVQQEERSVDPMADDDVDLRVTGRRRACVDLPHDVQSAEMLNQVTSQMARWTRKHSTVDQYVRRVKTLTFSLKFHQLHLDTETPESVLGLRHALTSFFMSSGNGRRWGTSIPLAASVTIVNGCVHTIVSQRRLAAKDDFKEMGDQAMEMMLNVDGDFFDDGSMDTSGMDLLEELPRWDLDELLTGCPETWQRVPVSSWNSDDQVFLERSASPDFPEFISSMQGTSYSPSDVVSHNGESSFQFDDFQAQQHAAKLATPPTILRMNTCCLHEGAEAVIAMECELLEMDFLVCSQFGISVPIEVQLIQEGLIQCKLTPPEVSN